MCSHGYEYGREKDQTECEKKNRPAISFEVSPGSEVSGGEQNRRKKHREDQRRIQTQRRQSRQQTQSKTPDHEEDFDRQTCATCPGYSDRRQEKEKECRLDQVHYAAGLCIAPTAALASNLSRVMGSSRTRWPVA